MSLTCILDRNVLYTLAARLPENEPVVSTYVTRSPLMAAATAAITHSCSNTHHSEHQ